MLQNTTIKDLLKYRNYLKEKLDAIEEVLSNDGKIDIDSLIKNEYPELFEEFR